MKNKMTEMFGIEMPIFAFSHCRDVVAAVSRAGGMGVLGISRFSPDQLRQELDWIDAHVDDKPYGVDLLIPTNRIKESDLSRLEAMIPETHRQFVNKIMEENQVPELPDGHQCQFAAIGDSGLIGDRPWQLLDISLAHPKVKLYVNALGVPPKDIMEKCHDRGVKVGGMAGKVKHAIKHKEAGTDFIIGTGYEAAGHTGDVSTMVLIPQLVQAAAPIPVLAAGGIISGRQIHAAMCLGAQGVWTGSVWLATQESELSPAQREKIINSPSEGTVITKCLTGKTVRALKSGFTDAWEAEDAPTPLAFPLQSMLASEANERFDKFKVNNMLTYPAGQGIGQLTCSLPVQEVMYRMLEEIATCVEEMNVWIDA